MSLYPSPANWSTLNDQCLANMNDMISRYNKEIMICEVGMSWDQPSACNAFLTDLINKTKSLADNKGLGVFYWNLNAMLTGTVIHWVPSITRVNQLLL